MSNYGRFSSGLPLWWAIFFGPQRNPLPLPPEGHGRQEKSRALRKPGIVRASGALVERSAGCAAWPIQVPGEGPSATTHSIAGLTCLGR
jgi:hypothetical protein